MTFCRLLAGLRVGSTISAADKGFYSGVMDVLNGSLPNTAQRIYPVGHQQIRLIFNFLKKLEFNPSARSKGPKSNEAYSVDVFNSIINILAAPYSTVENSYSNISKIQDHKILFKTKHPYSRTIYKYNPPPNNQRKTIMVKPFYISIMDKNSGNVGNRMFMYMYARILQNLYLPNSEIVNFSINEFGIDCRPHNMTGRILSINGGHKHSMNSISYFAKNKIYDGVFFHGYVQRMEYYPCVDFCSSLFPNSIPKLQINDNEILINIRGAEILRAVHPDYVPVPIDFIEQVLNETGLSPVIMGQIGNDFYSEELKKKNSSCKINKTFVHERRFRFN